MAAKKKTGGSAPKKSNITQKLKRANRDDRIQFQRVVRIDYERYNALMMRPQRDADTNNLRRMAETLDAYQTLADTTGCEVFRCYAFPAMVAKHGWSFGMSVLSDLRTRKKGHMVWRFADEKPEDVE